MLTRFSLPFKKVLKNTGIYWPGWFTIVIWKAGVIILLGLTIKDFLPLLDDYQNNNAATQVQVVGHNKTVKPPSMVLSLPLGDVTLQRIFRNISNSNNSTCRNCEKMAAHSWDVWKRIDFHNATDWYDYNDFTTPLSKALLKNLFLENNFDVLNITNFDWNQPIVEAVWKFFACVCDVDQLGYDNQNSYRGLNASIQAWCFQNDIGDVLFSNKEKVEKLYEYVADILSNHIEHFYIFTSETNKKYAVPENIFVPKHRLRSVFSNDMFSYLLPMPVDKPLRVVINPYSYHGFWESLNVSDSVFVLENPARVSWPLSEYLDSDVIYQTLEMSEISNIVYKPSLKVTERRDGVYCHEEESTYQCRGNCMVGKIIDICQCIPFNFRDLAPISSDLLYCKLSDYDKCKINKSHEFRVCDQKCNNPCTYTVYQWHCIRAPSYSQKTRRLLFYFQSVISPFIEFSVTTKNTWEQFLSQFGALINFYLGFSGLSVIALIIYCIDLCKKWYSKRSSTTGIDDTVLFTKKVLTDGATSLNYSSSNVIEISHEPELSMREEMNRMKQELNEVKKELSRFRRNQRFV